MRKSMDFKKEFFEGSARTFFKCQLKCLKFFFNRSNYTVSLDLKYSYKVSCNIICITILSTYYIYRVPFIYILSYKYITYSIFYHKIFPPQSFQIHLQKILQRNFVISKNIGRKLKSLYMCITCSSLNKGKVSMRRRESAKWKLTDLTEISLRYATYLIKTFYVCSTRNWLSKCWEFSLNFRMKIVF